MMATYAINPTESVIDWYGQRRVGRKHHGAIEVKEGELLVEDGNVISGRVVVDMATIQDLDLKEGKMKDTLERHLKSSDFFDVEKYPTSELVIRSITDGRATVDLTIKGHTEPGEFSVRSEVGGETARLEGELVFDRSKFDVRYGSGKFFKGLGDELIEDDIRIVAKIVAQQEK